MRPNCISYILFIKLTDLLFHSKERSPKFSNEYSPALAYRRGSKFMGDESPKEQGKHIF